MEILVSSEEEGARRKVLGELNAELSENFPLELFQLIVIGVILCSNPYLFFVCSCPFPESISILWCSSDQFK